MEEKRYEENDVTCQSGHSDRDLDPDSIFEVKLKTFPDNSTAHL